MCSFALVQDYKLYKNYEILYVYFTIVSVVLSFYLFLRSRLLVQAFDLHMIDVEPFLSFFLRDHVFCLSCVKSLSLSLGLRLFILSDLVLAFSFGWICWMRFFFIFLHLIMFDTMNLCCQCTHQGED